MSTEHLALCRQDLRITARYIQLAAELSGFSVICMKHAAVRSLAHVLIRLIAIARGVHREEEFRSLHDSLKHAPGSIEQFPPLNALIVDRQSWLFALADAEQSLGRLTPNTLRPDDEADDDIASAKIIARSASPVVSAESCHWSRLSVQDLLQWQSGTEALLDVISQFNEEY